MSTTTALDLTAFAHRFHALVDYTATAANTVSSPLGAWLLLTQVAGPNPAALTDVEREQIEAWLGCDIDIAYAHVQNLLADVPAPVKLALHTWMSTAFANIPSVTTWRGNLGLANAADTPIPSKAVLDDWVKTNTLDIISEFPLDADTLRQTDLIIANAIATKVAWHVPFEETDNDLPYWRAAKLLLATSDHAIHLVRDEDGHLYAIVRNGSKDGLNVHAVIAEDASLSPQHVLAFAERYATAGYLSAEKTADLPRDSAIYTITDIRSTRDAFSAVLPAWTAESTHELLTMNMPFPEAVHAILANANPDDTLAAVQVAKAEYNKLGFEAAAVSMIAMARSAAPSIGNRLQVDVKFAHPYAVVATYQAFCRTRDQATSPWQNLPLFSAWVQQAAPVSDKTFD